MKHKITILTISRKWGGRCVAGYDHNDARVVRLVSDMHGKELETQLTAGINLLDVVEVEVICPCPYEHQTENVLISSNCGLKTTGRTDVIEKFDCLAYKGGDVFGDNRYKINDASNINHSIELVKFSQMLIYVEEGKTKADFFVEGKLHRWYRITDIVHEGETARIENGYAIITVPPSDGFTRESGYFKYIAAIYPTNV